MPAGGEGLRWQGGSGSARAWPQVPAPPAPGPFQCVFLNSEIAAPAFFSFITHLLDTDSAQLSPFGGNATALAGAGSGWRRRWSMSLA
jgi:hypothetical protein